MVEWAEKMLVSKQRKKAYMCSVLRFDSFHFFATQQHKPYSKRFCEVPKKTPRVNEKAFIYQDYIIVKLFCFITLAGLLTFCLDEASA